MKPYASYKPSGVAWLGDVPAHWEVKQARFVMTCNDDVLPESTSPGQVLDYIEISDVDEVSGIKGFESVKFSDAPSRARRLVMDGDVIVSTVRTYLRAVAAISNPTAETVVSTGFAVLRPRAIDSRYSKYAILYDGFISEVISRSKGISYPAINATDLVRISVPLPPPDEQQAIADYLDAETARIDMLVQEKEELIGLLREARSNRISELISGDGLPGSATGNPWAPHLPEGWQLKRLKHLAQVRSGLAKGKDTGSNTTVELPYLRVANVQEGRLDLREISTMPVEVDAVERFSLLEGDVLMNEGGDYDKVGRGAVWTGEISPCLHQNHVFAVRPVQRDLSEWISAITQTQYAKFYFMNNAKQSTNLASISQASVKELPILLPPKEQRDALLEKLGGELAAFDALITHTQEEIALLKELRAATIADAVLGRVDVRSLNRKQ